MNKVLDDVVSAGVPIGFRGLVGSELLEGCPQPLVELIAHDGIRLDGRVPARGEGEYEARLLEMGRLAPQLGNALDVPNPR